MKEPDIIRKVQAMLALADKEKNDSIAEVETAMNMAHKFLRKYGLSMADVMTIEEAQAGSSSDNIKECIGVQFKCSKVPKWETILISVVNKLTDTKTLYQFYTPPGETYGTVKFIFIGEQVDNAIAISLHKYLRKSVTKLSTKHQKEINGKFRQWRSFAEGCVCTLMGRALEINQWRPEDEKKNPFHISNFEMDEEELNPFHVSNFMDDEFGDDTHKKYALILAGKEKAIDDYIKQKQVEQEKLSTSANIDPGSFQLGSEAAADISLDTKNLIGG